MRKIFLLSAIVVLASQTAGGCFADDDGTCRPGSIRQDKVHSERYWLCNSNGTGETPVTSPVPPPQNPAHSWS